MVMIENVFIITITAESIFLYTYSYIYICCVIEMQSLFCFSVIYSAYISSDLFRALTL